jgi:hypothetical protein
MKNAHNILSGGRLQMMKKLSQGAGWQEIRF